MTNFVVPTLDSIHCVVDALAERARDMAFGRGTSGLFFFSWGVTVVWGDIDDRHGTAGWVEEEAMWEGSAVS